MAAELVGGAFLSASLQVLFDRMASQNVVDFVRGNKLNEGLLKKLKIVLLSANRVLNDAEMKQLTDSDVRKWLEELKDAIYNAEDLVYEINTEALRSEIEDHSAESSTFFKVRNFFTSRIAVKDVEARMVEIVNTVEHLMEQKKHLGLVEGTVVQTSPLPRSSAATLAEESDIYGRKDDKKAIIDFLLSDEVDGDTISVIPIVGMGGVGKTTLAQLVYRDIDRRVMDKPFDIKAWITVSEEYDVFTLTKSIYEYLSGSQNISVKETFQVQLKLKELLSGKRFLFVLDDVWNLTSEGWYDFKKPFESASLGSKIIVTTRSTKIGSIMGNVPIHYLPIISEEDSWELFTKYAFKNLKPSEYADLEAIGRQIVKKCRGLPLALKSLGSLLHTLQTPKEWENILKTHIWELPQEECKVLPALWLSYYYLPPHLKRCFAYCSIYPKDYTFTKEDLILLWMAEDLLHPRKNKILEEVGEEYFDELTSRSFFHNAEDGGFTMHDLVNDLAKYITGESCFMFGDNDSKVLRKTRHLFYFRHNIKDAEILKDLSKNKVLRTLLVNDGWREVKGNIINHEQLQSMQYLRVFRGYASITKSLDSIGTLKLLRYLDLSWNAAIEEVPDTVCTLYNLQTLLLRYCFGLVRLPNSIGKLKHLRYLDLSRTQVEKLPDSICNLHNLHTLNLQSCTRLTCLPTNFALLVNLRNLKIRDTSLKEMPPQMSKLKYLQVLTQFVVGKSSGSNIKELGKFQYLSGRLNISCLENVNDAEDVSEAYLKDKKNVSELRLEWNGDADDSSKAREILDRLEPAHTNLKEVLIANYQGTSFSDWVGHHSFSCIKVMGLFGCKNCYWLPPLGQLSCLEDLAIEGFDMVERIGLEFYYDSNGSSSSSTVTTNPPFKSLKRLSFGDMPQWKGWWSSIDGVFLNVENLEFWNCSKLNGECLPDYLPSLKRLDISSSEQLLASLSLSDCQCPSLEELSVSHYPKMESFPPGGRLRFPSNVKNITISVCEQLVSFSEEGWPSNLKSLSIRSCAKLLGEHSMTKWNLQMLTSLTRLDIYNTHKEKIDTFPEEEGQLPTTLTSLKLNWLRNLKSLNGSAFRHLTSLQSLSIEFCDQLQSLPEEVEWLPTTLTSLHLSSLPNLKSLNGKAIQRLPSLKHLSLFRCTQLQSLPEETLPASLLELNIRGCPLLKPLCRREVGEDWPKIAHIPRIYMDEDDDVDL